MDIKTAHRILEVQELILLDSEYTELLLEYREKNKKLCKLLEELDVNQRSVIDDFLSIGVALHMQILKIACTNGDITRPPSDDFVQKRRKA